MHAKSAGMKYMIFLLFTFCFQLVLGSQTVTGFLEKSGPDFYLIPKNSQNRYLIIQQNTDVSSSLRRLDKGDLISGHGSIDTINKKIRLESVDYVGLRKLLGPWISSDGLMIFKDFSTMKYTPRFSNAREPTPFQKSNYQRVFRYTLSPIEGEEWALFLSDNKSTTFATVTFRNRKIILKIYESESGKIIRTLKLERL